MKMKLKLGTSSIKTVDLLLVAVKALENIATCPLHH